jgi:hypothetical protein
MKPALRLTLLGLLMISATVAMALAAALVWWVPYEQITLVVDGQHIEIPPLSAGHWAVLAAALFFVVLVLLIVVPLAIAFGLAVPLAAGAVALAAAIAVAALALSPLILLGWLVVRLVRGRPAQAKMAA